MIQLKCSSNMYLQTASKFKDSQQGLFLDVTLLNEEKIISLILKEVEIILNFVDFDNKEIYIHLNNLKTKDYPRMFFVLFSISRAMQSKKLSESLGIKFGDLQIKVIPLFWRLYEKALAEVCNSKSDKELHLSKKNDFRYVEIYAMRFLNNLKIDYSKVLDSFKKGDYSSIYSHPVSSYIFMSLYEESLDLKKLYPYTESVFINCQRVFDYILHSSRKKLFLPFHFAELSNHKTVPDQLKQRACIVMNEGVDGLYLAEDGYSSGVAKCAEHYSRIGDFSRLNMCFIFLDKRRLSGNGEYISAHFNMNKLSDYLYKEVDFSQYVCLDTNAHLLNCYINLLENYYV